MEEVKIPNAVLVALVENTKEINEKLGPLTQDITAEEKEELQKDNVIKDKNDKASLSTFEKTRYANIGKAMMAPFLKSLKNLIALERKRNEMIIEDKSKTIENETKVQYGEEGESEISLTKLLLPIILAIGIAVYIFRDKIIKFFKDAWAWVTDNIQKAVDFFELGWLVADIKGAVNTIKTSFDEYWNDIKGSVLNLGTTIWNYIEPTWNSFIKKMEEWWESIKQSWNSFVTKFEELYDSFESAISDIGEVVSSISDFFSNALGANLGLKLVNFFSSEEEQPKKEEKAETPPNKVTESKKIVVDQNIEILTDSLKNSIASNIINDLSKKIEGGVISPEEAEKYKSFLKDQIKVDNGRIEVDFESARVKILEEAKKTGTNNEFIELLEKMKEEEVKTYSKKTNDSLNDNGLKEVQQIILESTKSINETFAAYDDLIYKTFAETWASFINGFSLGNTYTITPFHKESFDAMSNELIRLAKDSVEIITKQNAVLAEIKNLLSQSQNPAPMPSVVQTVPIQSKPEQTQSNSVANGAKKLSKNLWVASSHWA